MSEDKEVKRIITEARSLPPAQSMMQLSVAVAQLLNRQTETLAKIDALGAGVQLLMNQHYDIARAVGIAVDAVPDGVERCCDNCASLCSDGACAVWAIDESSDLLRPAHLIEQDCIAPMYPSGYFSCHNFDAKESSDGGDDEAEA